MAGVPVKAQGLADKENSREKLRIKTEIWQAIQTRRIANGLGLMVPATSPVKSPEEMSEIDLQKRQQRRERNKIAATRCRTRRKERITELLKQVEEMERSNMKLERNVSNLQTEKDDLEKLLKSHACEQEELS